MAHKEKKRQHTRIVRLTRMREALKRDQTIYNISSSNPSSSYKAIRKLRSSGQTKINKIKVGNHMFQDTLVPDGIYESIKELKTEPVKLPTSADYPNFAHEYNLILDICRAGCKIPPVSREKASSLLKSIRNNVIDLHNITALHYLYAGDAGLDHFRFLINTVIENISLANMRDLNSTYACVLYKGNGKDRETARSYRTISICPTISKALDLYVRDLSIGDWNMAQADTQYQGEKMSHELASILLTETINYACNINKEPVYALFLDARSAFDRVIREILVRNMYIAGTDDQRLVYLDHRLSHRETYCDYNKELMGPIRDVRGLEQGGISSSDEYKIYNNEQAIFAQLSSLGVTLGNRTISCVSLADDAVLLSSTKTNLKNLLL